MLTEEQKKELKEWVDKIEIDVEDLQSAHFDSNPYGLEEPLYYGSGQWEYDEDEEQEVQKEKAIDYLETDGGVADYFGWSDDEEESEELTKEAVEYIKTI